MREKKIKKTQINTKTYKLHFKPPGMTLSARACKDFHGWGKLINHPCTAPPGPANQTWGAMPPVIRSVIEIAAFISNGWLGGGFISKNIHATHVVSNCEIKKSNPNFEFSFAFLLNLVA